MSIAWNSVNLAERLASATHHLEEQRTAMKQGRALRPTYNIAISREVGALGTTVAREVGARLGWYVYDHELLEVIAQELHVRTQLLENVDEKHVPWLQERIEEFAAVPHVTENAFVRQLIETVLALATHGGSVFVGRGVAHILPPSKTLAVRCVATLGDRIATIMREQGLAEHEAERYIKTTDAARERFVRDHFQRDSTDVHSYGLTLNTSWCSVSECADMIIDNLRRREPHLRMLAEQPVVG